MFVTQGPVDPESRMFAGRATELRQMEAWLPTTRCVGAVLGARAVAFGELEPWTIYSGNPAKPIRRRRAS